MSLDGEELFERFRALSREGLEPNLRRFLNFRGVEGPLELQALKIPTGRFMANRFAHARNFEEAVKLANEAETWNAPGVYVIGNEVDPAVATRAQAGQWHDQPSKGGGTSDSEIRSRRLLYFDFDSARPKDTSATADQVKATLDVTGRAWLFVSEIVGVEATAIGMSGNGGSLFVALADLPISDKLDETVKGLLAAVKAIYERPGTEVDVSVCDPKRLMPCFGTTKRKGAAGIATHPHRRTSILVPENPRRIDEAALTPLLAVLLRDVPKEKRADVDKAMGKKAAPVSIPRQQPSTDIFAQVNRDCDVRRVATLLGLSDGQDVKCPGCGITGDSSVAFVGNGIKCSHARCAQKGMSGFRSVVDVVVESKGCGVGEALQWLASEFGIALPDRPRSHAPMPRPAKKPDAGKFHVVAESLRGERMGRLRDGKCRLSFGVSFLDHAMGGIMPNDLVMIGARTGVGKTELAKLIALHNCEAGKRVHYFALEAEDREIERRMKYQLVAGMFFKNGGDFARTPIRYLDWRNGDLDGTLGRYEDKADQVLSAALANLRTFYRVGSFTSEDFERRLREIREETDLAILDHFHYVDDDAKEENRGQKQTVKTIRDAVLELGKPVIVVAHIRKRDRRGDQLIPDEEDFHGSSDIPKIATKCIMLAPAYDQPSEHGWLWNTYMRAVKCRTDQAVTRYAALIPFNSKLNIYENEYALGRLTEGGTKFEQVNNSELPPWARLSA